MTHLKLVRPLPGKKRQHELLELIPFLKQVTRLMDTGAKSSGATRKATGAATKKTGGSAAVRKAAIKKKAMAKRKA